MRNELDPIVDQWYQHRDKGELMRVIAVDQAASIIEIQDFAGDIEAIDFDSWHETNLELAEAPEDWTGPYDDIETDDLGYSSDTAMTHQDWRKPLDTLHSEDESWQDTRPLDERLEEEEGRPVEPYQSEED